MPAAASEFRYCLIPLWLHLLYPYTTLEMALILPLGVCASVPPIVPRLVPPVPFEVVPLCFDVALPFA